MAPKHGILMAGERTAPLVDISEYLDDDFYSMFLVQARRPMDYLLERRNWQPAGAIVRLVGDESAEGFLPVFQAHPATSFLFLLGTDLIDPELTGVVEGYGGTVIDAGEKSPQRIVEDLAALMFHHKLL